MNSGLGSCYNLSKGSVSMKNSSFFIKCDRYLHKTNTNVFTIPSVIEGAKLHLPRATIGFVYMSFTPQQACSASSTGQWSISNCQKKLTSVIIALVGLNLAHLMSKRMKNTILLVLSRYLPYLWHDFSFRNSTIWQRLAVFGECKMVGVGSSSSRIELFLAYSAVWPWQLTYFWLVHIDNIFTQTCTWYRGIDLILLWCCNSDLKSLQQKTANRHVLI